MSDLVIRAATDDDVEGIPEFWADAAEGTSISDDRNGVATLIARDRGRLCSRSPTVSSSAR
jgi:hypothetical protein